MKADANTESEVIAVINKLSKAFAKQDLNATLALFAPDPDIVLIGPEADVRGVGLTEIKAAIQRSFEPLEGASVKIDRYLVSSKGPTAWVTADANLHVKASGQETDLQLRLTAVLEQREDKWFIMQCHDSLPAVG